MATFVFYHSADLDGHSSAAIALDSLDDETEEYRFFAINYEQDFPFDKIKKSDTVYLLDYSLQPFSDMIRLNNSCRLIWIDHHESAIEEAKKHPDKMFLGNREVGKGACELTWEYFHEHDKKPLPKAISFLSRYDVWDLSDPDILKFQFGMRLHDTLDPRDELWKPVLENDSNFMDFVVQAGGIVLTYKKQEDTKYIASYGFKVNFEGYECVACNKGMTNSQLFESLAGDYDIYITFVRNANNKDWTISLYTKRDDIDVGKIAKNFGGGGHQKAAGFQIEELPF